MCRLLRALHPEKKVGFGRTERYQALAHQMPFEGTLNGFTILLSALLHPVATEDQRWTVSTVAAIIPSSFHSLEDKHRVGMAAATGQTGGRTSTMG